jgi:hypothetical protein
MDLWTQPAQWRVYLTHTVASTKAACNVLRAVSGHAVAKEVTAIKADAKQSSAAAACSYKTDTEQMHGESSSWQEIVAKYRRQKPIAQMLHQGRTPSNKQRSIVGFNSQAGSNQPELTCVRPDT